MPFSLSRRAFRCVAFCLSFLFFPCCLFAADAEGLPPFAPEREEFFQPLFFEDGSGDVQLNEGTNLKELGADSFDLLELVTALEDEFSMTFADDAVGSIATVGEVVDAIASAQ